jgi:N-acetyl-alpha-D-muramate 1-phosphate uridylyltransferase
MIKNAVILAAGFGRRLNPLTLNCPKPLLKIGNETLLSNTIKFLEEYKINNVIINVHYLKEQIIEYISKKNFNLKITIIEEKNKILDTGGGILNAIKHLSDEPILTINPDTVWNFSYLKELSFMDQIFHLNKKNKCYMLLVNKNKSFDKDFKGDFNLKNNFINKKNKVELKYIYTGLQIIKPEVFFGLNKKIFSINKIWDKLIDNNELNGIESKINFLHISNLKIYNKLKEKNFKH